MSTFAGYKHIAIIPTLHSIDLDSVAFVTVVWQLCLYQKAVLIPTCI